MAFYVILLLFVNHLNDLQTAWRLVLSMKPWSYRWLEFGLFSANIAIISACACWALFVVTLTNTVHLIYIYIFISEPKLDMLMPRWLLKSPRSLSSTSAHPTMITLINIMVMNGWLTSFSIGLLSISHPIPEIRLFQTLTLKLQGHGHGCSQRARPYSGLSVLLICVLFISYQSDQQFLRYSYFSNLTLKHPWPRSWVQSKVKVTYHTQYPTDTFPFCFTSIGPNLSEIWPKLCLTLQITSKMFKQNLSK